MNKFKVKRGMSFGKDNQYGPGDNVVLSPEDAAGFLDKLEPVDEPIEEPAGWNGLDGKIVAALEAAGFSPLMVADNTTDDELLAIEGIGQAAVKKIRSALGNAS
jgi:hypothetical protein